MAIVSLTIPQIGEGLQEARLVAVLKKPGDFVKRDEPIYQMETDKAVMDVESPYEGILTEWLAPVDTILPIGGEVARMDVSEGTPAQAPTSHAPAPASTSASNIVSLRIPQIGEGLQEARLVATLKNAGDHVKRDEAIYQMETDKAVMDVESPYEGTLVEWLAPVDTVLAIGAEVARMQVVGEVSEAPPHGHAPAPAVAVPAVTAASGTPVATRGLLAIPPRTRAYAKEKGIAEDTLASMAAPSGKLMPTDIDAYLAGTPAPAPKVAAPSPGGRYAERALSQKQRLLSSRLVRANQLVVPGTMTVAMDWSGIESLRAKNKGSDFNPSAFTMFAYACVRALADYPAFRTSMRGDDTLRTYEHVNLGIAVALPGDELVLAVIDKAETMDWRTFAAAMRERIEAARNGQDQAHEGVTVSLTNMQHHGIRDAVAVVVPPSVATVFLGETYNGLAQHTHELKLQRCANLGITFDHRLINGVGAAEFQNAIKTNVEKIEALLS